MNTQKETPQPNKCPVTYTSRGTRSVKFNTGIVRFSKLYILKNTWAKYVIAVSLGFIMSIFSVLLVEVTGLYTGGITAMFQGLARLVYSYMSKTNPDAASFNSTIFNLLYWGMYLTINIPLLIFAYKKINKNFALLSGVYLITLQLMGFIWSLVPGFHEIMLFGDTLTVDKQLQDINIQVILFKPNRFPTELIPHGWDWYKPNTNPSIELMATITSQNTTKAFLLLIYSFVFACLTSTIYTFLYILGGSSAGSDIISIFYSQERNKNLGLIIFIIHSVCMSLGILMGSYFSGIIVSPESYSGWQYLISANFVSSFAWVMLHSIMINRIFPWKKLVRVEIFTNKLEEIRCHLLQLKYIHPTTIVDATGGYSQQKSKIIMTICTCVEVPNLIQFIRQVDDKCLISTSQIVDLDGSMIVQKQTG